MPDSRDCVQSIRNSLVAAAKAGEGRLVLGVDGLALLGATTAAATEVTTAGTTAATATATLATGTTTAATAAAGTLLNEAVLELDELLDLALALALRLAGGGGEELFLLILGDRNEVLPLVLLDVLVGLADVESGLGLEGRLLLKLLSEVLLVADVLVLGLLLLSLGLGGSLAFGSLLLLRLGNGLASLLVLKLSIALVGTPRLGGLLLRVAATEVVNSGPGTAVSGGSSLLEGGLVGVAIALLAPATTACISRWLAGLSQFHLTRANSPR